MSTHTDCKCDRCLKNAAIQEFDSYDYQHLVELESYDVKRIEAITDEELLKIAAALKSLIAKGKLHLMDKDVGAAFQASVVVGFNKGGLLIAHER